MGYAYIPKNKVEVYEANFTLAEVLRAATIPAFQDLDYTIWDPKERKPFSWTWFTNDGQYMDAADALKLGQALKDYLATPEARQNYADYYDNDYQHKSFADHGPRPSRDQTLADFMAHANQWADFLIKSGGFEIR